jgi:signal transduction histidine kinase
VKTYFAPTERASSVELQHQVELVEQSPVMAALLEVVGGLLAILNKQRQILAVNEALLAYLGIEAKDFVSGLRPGEAVQCIHAHEMEGGCGASKFCSTCGAAIAIVTSLQSNKPEIRKCVITVPRNGATVELCLSVRASTIQVDGQQMVLLFLQDISAQEWRETMAQTFIHDINNVIAGLLGTCALIDLKADQQVRPLINQLKNLSTRLAREIQLQSMIMRSGDDNFTPMFETLSEAELMDDLSGIASSLASGTSIRVQLPAASPEGQLFTDRVVITRVLTNMLKNALEASKDGDTVKLSVERTRKEVVFSVWNRQSIPEDIGRRVFQCHFSTKPGGGRGFGTYSMRLFGERFLKGRVDFISSGTEGTTFRIILPQELAAAH